MRYCFDIDGVLCSNTKGRYPKAVPLLKVILEINRLYDSGHTIILYTARGSTTGVNWRNFTIRQLKEWNVKYHKLVMDKPGADIYIDDKCMRVSEWLIK